jgi:hypothetical protein
MIDGKWAILIGGGAHIRGGRARLAVSQTRGRLSVLYRQVKATLG